MGIPLALVACEASVTVCDAPEDSGGGLETCETGLVTRKTAVACESALPRSGTTCEQDPMLDACNTDADCTEAPNGHCESSSGFDGPGCFCSYGCVEDADCGDNAICSCGELVGHCESAACKTNADCGEGFVCGYYVSKDELCSSDGWACTTAEDECATHADCPASQECFFEGGKRSCRDVPECAIGRPFLIDDAPRLAGLAPGEASWCGAVRDVSQPSPPELRELASRWCEIGLMEHASIAAFARFSLELLSLGAPPELLRRAQQAMADETRHAELAFGLARAYGGQIVGPGPLSIEGALAGRVDEESLLRQVFREGCVGETVAALEAGEGAVMATGGAERALLEGIVRDEGEHAALAWATVRWLCQRMGARAHAVLASELARASHPPEGRRTEGVDLTRFGLLGEARRAALRVEVVRDLVAPWVSALRSSDSTRAALHARP